MRSHTLLSALAIFVLAIPTFGASQLVSVSIDTSSLPPLTSGYLDFLFNGSGPSSQLAQAQLSGFSTNGLLNSASVSTSGTVTGTLPNATTISNNNSEYLEAITFGTAISFGLQFSGPAIDMPSGGGSGSTFTLSLLNATLDGSYLTSDVNDGFLLSFNIDGKGQIESTTYQNSTGGPSAVTIGAAPEPASALLLLAAVAIFGCIASLGQRRRHAAVGESAR